MTIESAVARNEYPGNDVANVFEYGFRVFAASDVKVIRVSPLGAETTLTLNTDYTVQGVGDAEGGTVTLSTVLATGCRLVIYPELEFVQPTSIRNQGSFAPALHEDQFDRQVRYLQQLALQVERSLRSSPADGLVGRLPPKALRAGKLLSFDENGNPVAFDPSNVVTSVAYENARVDVFDGDGSTIVFTLTSDPGVIANTAVFVGGAAQPPDGSAYVLNDTGYTLPNVKFIGAPPNGSKVVVAYRRSLAQGVGDASDVLYIGGGGFPQRSLQDRLRERVSAKDAGAVGNRSADDTVKIASLLAAAGRVAMLPAATGYLVTALANHYGVEFEGPGHIFKAVTGGYQQLDTYVDRFKLSVGREYLHRCYEVFAQGQASSSGTLGVVIFGNSTAAGGNGESAAFAPHTLLGQLLKARGVGNASVTNYAVSGSSVGDLDFATDVQPHLGTSTHLMVIKFGGNEAADGLAQFKTDLRALLASVRADTHGGIGSLSIILVGDGPMSDTPNGRDEAWFEQLRGVYVAAARDYQCAYFDTYAHLKDARGAAGLWMDDPYSDGRAIHPLDSMNAWIWGGLVDWAFNASSLAPYAANVVTNQGAVSDVWSSSTVPANYKFGIAIQRATVAHGAPWEGSVVTVRSVDGPAVQMLFSFAANVTRVAMRTASTGSNTWNRWSGVRENLTLSNSWVSYGSSFGTPAAAIDNDGFVTLTGMVKDGTTTAGTVIGTLPTGMAPAEDSVHVAGVSGGTCLIKVNTSGEIVAQSTANATYTSLAGIRFRAAG